MKMVLIFEDDFSTSFILFGIKFDFLGYLSVISALTGI